MKRVLAIVVCAACGQAGGGNHHNTPNPDARIGDWLDGKAADAPNSPAARTIFTIVMENHDYAEIVGSSNAPYINSLIAQGGLATSYKDTGHPSCPNYLDMISGANQYPGVIDVGPQQWPYFPAMQPNLGSQFEAAGVPWHAYAEDMGTACNLTDSGNYATKHLPFLYFTDMQMGPCAQRVVDFAQSFTTDLAANTYRYMWITPNLLDDGHDPSTDPVTGLHQSDAWLETWIPRLQASPGYQNGGVIFITWDEAEGRNGDNPDQIPMIVLSTKIKQAGMTSATAFTHTSYTATIEDMLGLPRLQTTTSQQNTLLEFLNW